jgi:ribosomal peptide maturation radical SAM protein 1
MMMTYRSKSADRALDELVYLTSKYPDGIIQVVDNILDMKYFKDFIPELAARQLDLELYYELKANLRKEQVQLLRDAGITRIQPGIESLSSQVLKLMRKGTKALQNIQLLKWCKELGVRVYWNMLWGFPGEPPEEYAHVADLIPLLTHLQPPNRAGAIRLDRFSPNFEYAAQLGLANVVPYPAYHYIYPLAPEVVANLAYYFTFEYREPQDVASYTQPVIEEISAWQAVHGESELLLVDKGAHCPLQIWDLRPVAHDPLTILAGLQRILYLECDRVRTVSQLQQVAEAHAGGAISAQEIEEFLQPLVERGLMLREGRSYLSLAVPLGEYLPNRPVLEMVKPLQ